MDLDDLLALESRIDFRPGPEEVGLRLDLAIAERAPWASRSRIARWIAESRVQVGGVVETRPGRKLAAKDHVVGRLPKSPRDLEADCADLLAIPVLAEGADWVALDKPPGISPHPAGGEIKRTLLVAAAMILAGRFEQGGPWLPHRLDRDTSGLIVVTLARAAQRRFAAAFAALRIRRFYRARTGPWPEDRLPNGAGGWIDLHDRIWSPQMPQGRVEIRPDGLESETRVRILARGDDWTDLEVEPITGRSHQIRAQLAHAGAAILGDRWYGPHAGRAETLQLRATRLLLPADIAGEDVPREVRLPD